MSEADRAVQAAAAQARAEKERVIRERRLSREVDAAKAEWAHYRRMFRLAALSLVACVLVALVAALSIWVFEPNPASIIAVIVFLLGAVGAFTRLCTWHYDHNGKGELQRAVRDTQADYDDFMTMEFS